MSTNPTPDASALTNSLLRTGVAIAAGAVTSWAIRHGLSINQASVDAWLTPVATGGYYTVIRVAEHYLSPAFGWLLGMAKAPAYSPAPPPQSEPLVTPNPNK